AGGGVGATRTRMATVGVGGSNGLMVPTAGTGSGGGGPTSGGSGVGRAICVGRAGGDFSKAQPRLADGPRVSPKHTNSNIGGAFVLIPARPPPSPRFAPLHHSLRSWRFCPGKRRRQGERNRFLTRYNPCGRYVGLRGSGGADIPVCPVPAGQTGMSTPPDAGLLDRLRRLL